MYRTDRYSHTPRGKKIENNAFEGCVKLTAIHLPDTVTEIGRHAFDGCIGLTAISIPKGLKKIRESAFCGCKKLSDIYLLNGMTDIGGSSFEGCSGLTAIHIPDSVTEEARALGIPAGEDEIQMENRRFVVNLAECIADYPLPDVPRVMLDKDISHLHLTKFNYGNIFYFP